MTNLQPAPQHRFTFGLPANGHRGPIREPAPLPIEPWDFVHGLAEVGAWGVAIQDVELVPPTVTQQERESIVGKFRAALDNTGVTVSAVATGFSRHPSFTGGAFTAATADLRRCAIRKTMGALDLGMELGSPLHVLSTAHEGIAATAAGSPADSLDRYGEAVNFLCEYVRDQNYPITFALASGADEPHGGALLPTIGHALAFIDSLDHPEMVGVSLRVAAEPTAGPSVHRGLTQAIWSGRLAHVDLAAARIDPDYRLGSGGLMNAFFLVKILEESGYAGPRHFGAVRLRGEPTRGIWDFASGCMRTYLALAAKAKRFAVDPDVQEALADAGALEMAEPTVGPYSREGAQQLVAQTFDPDSLDAGRNHEVQLEQLITDLVLGLR